MQIRLRKIFRSHWISQPTWKYETITVKGKSLQQYRDEDIGADMYKIMQWLEPKVVRDAALSKTCT